MSLSDEAVETAQLDLDLITFSDSLKKLLPPPPEVLRGKYLHTLTFWVVDAQTVVVRPNDNSSYSVFD